MASSRFRYAEVTTKENTHAWISSRPLSRLNVHTRCNLGARYRWGIEGAFLVASVKGGRSRFLSLISERICPPLFFTQRVLYDLIRPNQRNQTHQYTIHDPRLRFSGLFDLSRSPIKGMDEIRCHHAGLFEIIYRYFRRRIPDTDTYGTANQELLRRLYSPLESTTAGRYFPK